MPTGVPVRLLIDIGSGRSTLVPWVIAHLDPRPEREVRVETSGSGTATNLFSVRLEFPDSTLEAFSHVAVARVPLPPLLQEFHGLVGRDLLFRWEWFLLEGRRRRWSLRDTRPWFPWLWR